MTQPIDPRIEQILTQIEIYQQVAADYEVPTWQALPIASNPAIAFRPNCTQLEPVWQPTDTAWVWNGQTVYTTPGQGSMGLHTMRPFASLHFRMRSQNRKATHLRARKIR